MPSLRGLGVLAGSAGVLTTVFLSKRDQLSLWASSGPGPRDERSYQDDFGERVAQKWDYNWDKMAPIVDKENAKGNAEVATSKSSRTLILIRHGQYVWDPYDPDKRILTELGRKQAAITSQRLKDLGYSYSMLYYSTMPRATETADIMRQNLVGVSSRSCDLMREGAPIRPEPKSRTWHPESYVRNFKMFFIKLMMTICNNFEEFFQDGPRIEAAFRKYFYRAPPTQTEDTVEILVCHANVIRYFVCR